MNYTDLIQDERYQIHILKQAKHSQTEIADLMKRDKSTISRELKRNWGRRGYRPQQSHELSLARMRAKDNGRLVSAETWAFPNANLGLRWSLEKISGYLKANHMPTVSHETIYKRIYADKRAGGTLHATLRCQKLRKKRYGRRERRGTIPNQVSIEQRPAIVDTRLRFGDWEGELIIGADQQQALVALNERKSRYTLIGSPGPIRMALLALRKGALDGLSSTFKPTFSVFAQLLAAKVLQRHLPRRVG